MVPTWFAVSSLLCLNMLASSPLHRGGAVEISSAAFMGGPQDGGFYLEVQGSYSQAGTTVVINTYEPLN